MLQGKFGVSPGTSGLREAIAHKLFPVITPEVVISYIYSKEFIQETGEEGKKLCAVQKMVENDGNLTLLSPSDEAEVKPLLPKIIYIDLVIANSDRNRGNLLIKRTMGHVTDLIPIDHGYVLPDNFASGAKFCWYAMLDGTELFPNEITSQILKFDLSQALSIVASKLLDPIGAQNTLSVSLLLTKTLCESVPMKEIAMYQLERPHPIKDPSVEGEVLSFLTEKSLCHAILKLGALKQNPSICPSKDITEFVIPTHIQSAINDITSFIHDEKVFVEESLRTVAEKDPLIYSNKETSEIIHIVHRITREVLSEYIERNDTEGLLSNSWHPVVRRRIEKELSDPI